MAKPFSFEMSRAAVLSMDLQAAIVSIYTKGQGDLLTRVAGVLRKARDRGFMKKYAPKHCRNLAQSTYRTLFKVRRITQSWGIMGAYHCVPVPVFYCPRTLPPRKLAMLADGLGTLRRLARSYPSAA
jgi:hypothetical protein